jgi:hypothetical protein
MSVHSDEYFKIIYDDGLQFQIVKTTTRNNELLYSILDSHGHDCVHIIVQKNRLYLSQVTYRPTCTIGKRMERGSPTVKMVKTLLKKVMQDTTYDRIFLTDQSEIDCILPGDDDVAFRINLPMLSFITSGKTWYQKHFHAEFVSEKLKRNLEKSNNLLESPTSSDDIASFSNVVKEGLDSYKYERWVEDAQRIVVQLLTDNIGKSWRYILSMLFSERGELSKLLGENIGCLLFEMLQPTLIDMFNIPNLSKIEAFITRDTIMSYPETLHTEFVRNTNPVHLNKKRKNTFQKMAFLTNSLPIYTTGGNKKKGTRKVRHVPKEYRRNLFGYVWSSMRNKSRRNR